MIYLGVMLILDTLLLYICFRAATDSYNRCRGLTAVLPGFEKENSLRMEDAFLGWNFLGPLSPLYIFLISYIAMRMGGDLEYYTLIA